MKGQQLSNDKSDHKKGSNIQESEPALVLETTEGNNTRKTVECSYKCGSQLLSLCVRDSKRGHWHAPANVDVAVSHLATRYGSITL